MQDLPVHWSEGLFLQPHHLQANDRYWEEIARAGHQWDHPYHYGLRDAEISGEAIANQQFELRSCHARMKDGTLVSLDAGQGPDRVELKDAFAKATQVQVYLAVPKVKLGRVNVRVAGRSADDGPPPRYLENRRAVQDESFGGNDQELSFRDLNVRLLLSTQDTAGYETLPVAQVRRAGEKDSAPQLDDSYIPPLLAIDAWPPLARDIVRSIYDMLGRKIEVLSEQMANRGLSVTDLEPGDLERLLMLAEINAACAVLHVLTFARGVHPLTAYTELVRIVGQLSLFSPTRRAPEIPHYDHDDLARIFRWVKSQIELLLRFVAPPTYARRFFVGEGRGMRVALDPQWLEPNWTWYVGVHRGTLSDQDCLLLLSPGTLNWKLGSTRQVDERFQRGKMSLELRPLTVAPGILPKSHWLYYQVSRENIAWSDVLQTQTLAMRLQDRLIANLESLQGSSTILVSYTGKQVPLQFALFAVPKQP
jgi:type VI secretion system protein ImpJ